MIDEKKQQEIQDYMDHVSRLMSRPDYEKVIIVGTVEKHDELKSQRYKNVFLYTGEE